MSNTNILGDSIKKSRFNKDLADVVNKAAEYDSKKEHIAEKASNDLKKFKFSMGTNFEMHSLPVENGSKKKYVDWKNYWNAAHFAGRGYVMASCAELYIVGKSGDMSVINGLRDCFSYGSINGLSLSRGVMTNNLIEYEFLVDKADITSHHGSSIIQPLKKNTPIPIYDYAPIRSVLGCERGQQYMQTLFNTSDSSEEIADNLSELSGKIIDDIFVWTPGALQRAEEIDHVIILRLDEGDKFTILSQPISRMLGSSCGVKYLSEVKL